LGFSVGRIDGIHDERTAHAVADFQRNAGLVADGICGPDTLDALQRFVRHLEGADDMAALEERERFTSKGEHLTNRRIAIGERGGLDVMTAAVRRALTDAGAEVLTVHHPDWSSQANQVNGYGADFYIALEVRPEPPTIAFFEGEHFVSPGGRALAECLHVELAHLFPTIGNRGMRLPMLRETRMPAVLCRFEHARDLVRHNREIAVSMARAMQAVLISDLDDR
jgi:N-acetylmuramoyl-L-alanine amidase